MPADLHLHTTASDGSWEPATLLKTAKNHGLTTIAITDHDTIANIPKALSLADDLEVITGIEFSTEYADKEIHILGYGIDIKNRNLAKHLQDLELERITRAKRIVERLNSLGLELEYAQVKNAAGKHGIIGRVHIAQALVQLGYVSSVDDGFNRYLGHGKPAYVRRDKLHPKQAISLIKSSGGIPVIAHPGLIRNDALIPGLISLGIEGIEVMHPKHSTTQTENYLKLTKKRDLLPTGGSDCHGPNVKERVYLGSIRVPDTWVTHLKAALAKT